MESLERMQNKLILIFPFDSVEEAFSAHIPKYGFRFACTPGQSGLTLGSIEAFLCLKMSLLLSIVSTAFEEWDWRVSRFSLDHSTKFSSERHSISYFFQKQEC